MAAGRDPRDRITPVAFRIAPDLLGVELATPWRRALALGLDLLLAGTVSAVGGSAAVGLTAAVLFFLVAMRRGSRHPVRRVVRGTFVLIGAVILFGVGIALVEGGAGPGDHSYVGSNVGNPFGDEWAQGDSEAILEQVEEELAAAGLTVDLEPPAAMPDTLSPAEREAAAQTLRTYADALAAGDTVATDSLAPAAADLVAGSALRQRDERIDGLRDRVRRLEAQREALQEALDSPSFLRTAQTLAGDFGLTLGWIGVYFTLVLAWWGGYTPGKRALGIRVVRLDGRPVTLWNAFERFGGYAAGLVTGLVGFAQVLWDANRQGVQDKIAGTAVVRMADAQTPRRLPEP